MFRLAGLIFICIGFAVDGMAGDQRNASDATTATKPAISKIAVSSSDKRFTVEITTTAHVSIQTRSLSHPERFIFDFPRCGLPEGNRRIPVERGPVKAVRASTFQTNPLIARVVIDLREPHTPQIEQIGETLRVSITDLQAGAPKTTNLSKQGLYEAQLPPSVLHARNKANSTSQNHAYGLLDKSKLLNVSDLQPLEDRATAGDPEAQTTLALAYHAGVLLKRDDEQALQLLYRAAERHFVGAEEALATFCELGIGRPPNPTEALGWYTKAANHGSVDAETSLGILYATGNGSPKDSAKALTWFQRAADAGNPTAQLNLAAMYHSGEGVPTDPKKSKEWLTKAAEQNLIPAMLELARVDIQPVGAPTDAQAAIYWLERAARLGDAFAEAALGQIFADGIGVKRDYDRSIVWYRKSAEQGQRDGEFGLAMHYWLGQGVASDPQQARDWFALAAAQGHTNSQYNLGVMYESGKGLAPDLDAAISYYQMAAEQGVANAQYRLGRLLKDRHASSADLVNAYRWLVLAQDKVEGSASAAAELRQSMTPSQIADAEQQIDAWRVLQSRKVHQ
jgi:TPR repeat protein